MERLGLRKYYQAQRESLAVVERDAATQKPSAAFHREVLLEAALAELHYLDRKLETVEDRAEIAQLFRSLNLRVWLDFKKENGEIL